MNHETPGWNPHTLTECVDSIALGYATAILAVGVLIWYVRIALRWWRALQSASDRRRTLWGWLIVIFLVCAMAGYTSWVLAMFIPKVAVILRLVSLAVLWVACPCFLWLADRHKFHLVGVHESVGEQMMTKDLKTMSQAEIAIYAMEVVSAALRKTNHPA